MKVIHWSCLVVFLLSGCIDTSKVHIKHYPLELRFLACDFVVKHIDDNTYIIKWHC